MLFKLQFDCSGEEREREEKKKESNPFEVEGKWKRNWFEKSYHSGEAGFESVKTRRHWLVHSQAMSHTYTQTNACLTYSPNKTKKFTFTPSVVWKRPRRWSARGSICGKWRKGVHTKKFTTWFLNNAPTILLIKVWLLSLFTPPPHPLAPCSASQNHGKPHLSASAVAMATDKPLSVLLW